MAVRFGRARFGVTNWGSNWVPVLPPSIGSQEVINGFDVTYKAAKVLKYYIVIKCPLDMHLRIGARNLAYPVANSTNQISMTLLQDQTRITDATVRVTVYAPDGITKTLDNVPMPHTGNGVYSYTAAPSVAPKKGQGYLAVFNIVRGGDSYNPQYFFEVFES